MANKFNLDFLNGEKNKSAPNLDNFKTTSEIFGKANSAIDTLPIDKLIWFKDHPFKIREGERLNELTESIAEQGVLVPLIVRIHKSVVGSYEILAGHHRFEAAKRAGLVELPCIIKNVDDNQAVLIVVESNKQRGFADMLPSEIAKALKMEYDALKCQGKRTDLMQELDDILNDENFNEKNGLNADDNSENSTSFALRTKLDAITKAGEKNQVSRTQTYYYIRLNSLIQTLLDLVDEDEISIRPAVDLSYLSTEEQEIVALILEEFEYKIDMKKSAKLKEYSQSKKINEDTVKLILSGTIFEVKPKKITSIKLPVKKISAYMPKDLPTADTEDYIIKALEFYKNNGADEYEYEFEED